MCVDLFIPVFGQTQQNVPRQTPSINTTHLRNMSSGLNQSWCMSQEDIQNCHEIILAASELLKENAQQRGNTR
jgi:hypothetical protein